MAEEGSAGPRAGENRAARLQLSILVIIWATLIAATVDSYGVSYDQPWRLKYGEHILAWYRSLFTDHRALDYSNLLKYSGSFFGPLVAVARRLLPLGTYETSHALSASLGLVAAVGTYKIGETLFGGRAGVMAALLLATMPRFYGHGFINAGDIPFAAATTFTLYYTIRVLNDLPQPRWSLLVKLGIALGLAMTTRIGGVLYVGYLGLGLAVWLLAQRLGSEDRVASSSPKRALRASVRVAVIVAHP